MLQQVSWGATLVLVVYDRHIRWIQGFDPVKAGAIPDISPVRGRCDFVENQAAPIASRKARVGMLGASAAGCRGIIDGMGGRSSDHDSRMSSCIGR
jgi:hypothetical protein